MKIRTLVCTSYYFQKSWRNVVRCNANLRFSTTLLQRDHSPSITEFHDSRGGVDSKIVNEHSIAGNSKAHLITRIEAGHSVPINQLRLHRNCILRPAQLV